MTNLDTMSGPELVLIYNDIATQAGISPVKRFATRDAGVVRVMKVLAANPKIKVTNTVDNPTPKTTGLTPKKWEFNLPASDEQATYRAGSGRGKLIAALREGRTFSALQQQFSEWTDAHLAGNIRSLSRVLGFGMSTDNDGVITLFD